MTPEALAEMHGAAFADGRAWSADEFRRLLQGENCRLVSHVNAFLLGRIVLDEAEVLTLCTHPEFRRNGLAATCLREFESLAQKAGVTRIFLEVAADNHAALALYDAAGYSACGRRAGYYETANPQKAIDAIVLAKKVPSWPPGIRQLFDRSVNIGASSQDSD